jgi:integrase
MAGIQRYPSGHYHVTFRFAGRKYNRSLETKSETEARDLAGRIQDNIRNVQRGLLALPPGIDIPTFLLSDGRMSGPVQVSLVVTLKELIERYEKAISCGAVEESTLYTIRIHMKHLKAVLDEGLDVHSLTRNHLQEYVNRRRAQKNNRGGTISPVTIRKELATLSGAWTWGIGEGLVGPFPNKGLKYPKGAEKPPFQTWQEIEKQIARGRLTKKEQAALWECLFLTLEETADLLRHVEKVAQPPFLYPMVVMAAHTGARRSELLRSRLVDFDDESVVIRERKKSKRQHTTRRVPLSPFLKKVMRAWFEVHPGGPFTFCQPKTAAQGTRAIPQSIKADQAQD